jgi:hypothetical protein
MKRLNWKSGVFALLSAAVFACLGLPARCWSQGPTKAEVIQAGRYFSERNVLPQLVALTRMDSEQSTRFSDVIVACYNLYQDLDRLSKSQQGADRNLKSISASLAQLQDRLNAKGQQNQEWISEITAEVLQKIQNPGDQGGGTMAGVGADSQKEIKKIEKQLLDMQKSNDANRKDSRQAKQISIASICITGVIALLSAL